MTSPGTAAGGSEPGGAAGACEAGGPAGGPAGGAKAGGTWSSATASAEVTSASTSANRRQRTRYFFGLGRIESAVPWMNAFSFSMSAGERRPVKSGIPLATNGPLKTYLSSSEMISGLT